MQKIAFLASWLASLVRGVRKRAQRAAQRARLAARSSYKLDLGVLEDRIVPSTFTFSKLNYSVFPDYPDRPANRRTLESEPEGGIVAVRRDTTGTSETVKIATADGSVDSSVYAAINDQDLEFGPEATTAYFDVAVTNAGVSGEFQDFFINIFDVNDDNDTQPLDTAVVTFFEPAEEQDIYATAADLTYQVAQNQTLTVDAHFSLLQTAYNPWGDTLSISSNSDPVQSGATLTVHSCGKFEYKPPEDWTGTDSFTVTLNDG